ncbi:PurA ssDNA and RNA-binding protein [Musa troglodytarum]|uniref:PurA ssDNA and RNA-binding protein n=1 Tax=Musa troglodytarum TaxID=320322 RepID=A0A9E7IB04_9LILI|nr:PurA ssDNA and RNA-binding protein [Musa troglodytarum]
MILEAWGCLRRSIRIDQKRFFFDLGSNNRGHFLRISEADGELKPLLVSWKIQTHLVMEVDAMTGRANHNILDGHHNEKLFQISLLLTET